MIACQAFMGILINLFQLSCMYSWAVCLFYPLITQIASEVKWRTQAKNVWFPHAWDDVPLIVKTVSAIGSNDEIFYEVADGASDYNSFARVVVRMSINSIYYVRWCQNDTPLKDLPPAPDDIRIWKFIKHGFEGLSIECNGVEVADLRFSEARSECYDSKWLTTKVNYIKFNPDWDTTVAVGITGTFISGLGSQTLQYFPVMILCPEFHKLYFWIFNASSVRVTTSKSRHEKFKKCITILNCAEYTWKLSHPLSSKWSIFSSLLYY